MIVISGALVLVALVLLIIGLVATSLPFVYASIAVSVVSFVFLLIGILQRRGEPVPEPATGFEPARPQPNPDVDGVTAIIPAGSRAASEPAAAPVPAAAPATVAALPDDAPVSGSVLVVPGRPRYHVSGCRYLTGKDPEELDVNAARERGYASCGVCKPDRALAEAVAEPHPQPDEPIAPVDEPTPIAKPAAAAVPKPRKARTASATATAADPAVAARKTTKAPPAAKAPAKTAPAKAPAKKAPAKAAAAPKETVVVIPDRGKYHRADCRYVRGVDGAQELTKPQATRQGYAACGVCKP